MVSVSTFTAVLLLPTVRARACRARASSSESVCSETTVEAYDDRRLLCDPVVAEISDAASLARLLDGIAGSFCCASGQSAPTGGFQPHEPGKILRLQACGLEGK
eukprot:SAG31_NODE_281_length_18584_cov_10.762564_3_plen_104_part_00